MQEVINLISEIKDDIKAVNNTQIKHGVLLEGLFKQNEKIGTDIDRLKEENIIQSKDILENKESLVRHMEQTTLVRQMAQKGDEILKAQLDSHKEDNVTRFEKLETPKKVKQFLFDVLIKAGSGAVALYGLLQLLGYLK